MKDLAPTIIRTAIAFVLAITFYLGVAFSQAGSGHALPTMTPDVAPVPRAAPTTEIARAKPTPPPLPANGP